MAGFQQGKSGNPGGRPKRDKFLTQHIIAELHELDPERGVDKARGLVIALIDKGLTGDVAAFNAVMDRIEGKVTQPIGGDEENPLTIALTGLGASVDGKLARLISGRTPKPESEPDR